MEGIPSRREGFFSRRRFVRTLLGAAAGGLAFGIGSREGRYPESFALRKARIAGPAGWAGKSAVFLTDIHYGNFFGPEDAKRLQAQAAAMKPDLVVLGGDLAHTPRMDLDGFFDGWKPGCPVLFAPGNHDLRIGQADSRIMRQVAEAGFTILSNRAETWNGLTFVGFPSALRLDQRRSLLQRSGLKIILAHEPDIWDYSTEPDLVQLAGHTHGGQVCFFGRALRLPPLGQKYRLGRFEQPGNRTLLVSAGIGVSSVPLRIDCPPEIYRIEFV